MDVRKLALTVTAVAVLAVGAGSSVALARTLPVAAGAVTVEPGGEVTLGDGQAARLSTEDVTVRYAGLVEDSRCPVRVTCVGAGEAAVAVQVREPGRGERAGRVLHTGGPRLLTYAGMTVRLVDVSRDGDRITVRLG